ncbi:hypothetical protein HDU81_010430 [Chytriomyces hyalinus]|nr:hypothetical protein HDU81_010430 [Chytriomyces hyalinus]
MDENESEVELGDDEYVVAGIKDHKYVPDKALLAEYKTRTKESKPDENPRASSRRSSSMSTRTTTTNAKAVSSSTRGSPRVSLTESASKSRRLSSGLPNGRASRSSDANNSPPSSKKRASRSKSRKSAEEEKESNSEAESTGRVQFQQSQLVAECPDVVKIPGYLFSLDSWDAYLENINVMVRSETNRDLFASLKWKKGVLLSGHTSTEIGLELANEKCPRFMNRFYYTRLRLSKG